MKIQHTAPRPATRIVRLDDIDAAQLIAAVRVAIEEGRPVEVDRKRLRQIQDRLGQAFVARGRIHVVA